jgi:hypothetical protein
LPESRVVLAESESAAGSAAAAAAAAEKRVESTSIKWGG